MYFDLLQYYFFSIFFFNLRLFNFPHIDLNFTTIFQISTFLGVPLKKIPSFICLLLSSGRFNMLEFSINILFIFFVNFLLNCNKKSWLPVVKNLTLTVYSRVVLSVYNSTLRSYFSLFFLRCSKISLPHY